MTVVPQTPEQSPVPKEAPPHSAPIEVAPTQKIKEFEPPPSVPPVSASNSPPASKPFVAELLERSLPNGTEIVASKDPGGLGILVAKNGSRNDAYVKLVDGNTVLKQVYIKTGDEITVTGIGPCSCKAMFASGVDFDTAANRFTRRRSFMAFDNPLQFSEDYINGGVRASKHTISLNPVPEGNASVHEISEQEFDAVMAPAVGSSK
jgi:hypothetical protein